MECHDTRKGFSQQTPYLACEYSKAPAFSMNWLSEYNPIVLTISEFARANIINTGYDANKTFAVHLGSDSKTWYKTGAPKFDTFTYLTVNSSTERSGFEALVPAFIEFSKDKDVNLIIKDAQNPKFRDYIQSLNNKKIIYIDAKLSEASLRALYNRSHMFLYTNNTTSFGMTPLDAMLCGTPTIVTLGSALKEFIPEWTQPAKVKTTMVELTKDSIKDWQSIGIASIPDYFLDFFGGPVYGERVIQQDILNSLEFSYANYALYQSIAEKASEYVIENLSWDKTVQKIADVFSK
jgi:glycosyltransferase involved in cell wall biosynthesis